jgi:predicted RNA-binding protein YlxR (DUF448 family)
MRTCVVCREARPKRELTRLVCGPDQPLQIDPGGKLPGRGAYLCDKLECWLGAAQGKALDAALRTELQDEDRVMLRAHAQELEVKTTRS